jgi:hypothetical protein
MRADIQYADVLNVDMPSVGMRPALSQARGDSSLWSGFVMANL